MKPDLDKQNALKPGRIYYIEIRIRTKGYIYYNIVTNIHVLARLVHFTCSFNPSLVPVQPRKTRPYITENLLMGRNASNQTSTSCAYFRLKLTATSLK